MPVETRHSNLHWLTAGMSVWPPSLGMIPTHGVVCGFAAGERKERGESREQKSPLLSTNGQEQHSSEEEREDVTVPQTASSPQPGSR